MVMDSLAEFSGCVSAFRSERCGTTMSASTRSVPKRGTQRRARRRWLGLGTGVYLESSRHLRAGLSCSAASRLKLRRNIRWLHRYSLLLGQLAEHRDGFDLDQQFRAAELSLDASGGRQRVQSLVLVKCRALLVELRVVAIDVAEVATCSHNIFPCDALGCKERGNVLEHAAALRAEVSDMDRSTMLIDAGR